MELRLFKELKSRKLFEEKGLEFFFFKSEMKEKKMTRGPKVAMHRCISGRYGEG